MAGPSLQLRLPTLILSPYILLTNSIKGNQTNKYFVKFCDEIKTTFTTTRSTASMYVIIQEIEGEHFSGQHIKALTYRLAANIYTHGI